MTCLLNSSCKHAPLKSHKSINHSSRPTAHASICHSKNTPLICSSRGYTREINGARPTWALLLASRATRLEKRHLYSRNFMLILLGKIINNNRHCFSGYALHPHRTDICEHINIMSLTYYISTFHQSLENQNQFLHSCVLPFWDFNGKYPFEKSLENLHRTRIPPWECAHLWLLPLAKRLRPGGMQPVFGLPGVTTETAS